MRSKAPAISWVRVRAPRRSRSALESHRPGRARVPGRIEVTGVTRLAGQIGRRRDAGLPWIDNGDPRSPTRRRRSTTKCLRPARPGNLVGGAGQCRALEADRVGRGARDDRRHGRVDAQTGLLEQPPGQEAVLGQGHRCRMAPHQPERGSGRRPACRPLPRPSPTLPPRAVRPPPRAPRRPAPTRPAPPARSRRTCRSRPRILSAVADDQFVGAHRSPLAATPIRTSLVPPRIV